MFFQLLCSLLNFSRIVQREIDYKWTIPCQLHVVEVPDCEEANFWVAELSEGQSARQVGYFLGFRVYKGLIHVFQHFDLADECFNLRKLDWLTCLLSLVLLIRLYDGNHKFAKLRLVELLLWQVAQL